MRSGTETAVCAQVSNELGLDTHVAMFVRWRKLPKHRATKEGKSKELVRTVLFPCYVFIKVNGIESLGRVLALKDVFSFVSTPDGPCYTDDLEVQRLKAQEASGYNDETEQGRKLRDAERLAAARSAISSMSFRDLKGAIVRLVSGPFQGKAGVVEEYNAKTGDLKFHSGRMSFSVNEEAVAVVA